MHPLSGYSVHFFLKAFELGKLQANFLLELTVKPNSYMGGYRSPYMQDEHRFPGGLGRRLPLTRPGQMLVLLASLVQPKMILATTSQSLMIRTTRTS